MPLATLLTVPYASTPYASLLPVIETEGFELLSAQQPRRIERRPLFTKSILFLLPQSYQDS